jgi:hypothetical protein
MMKITDIKTAEVRVANHYLYHLGLLERGSCLSRLNTGPTPPPCQRFAATVTRTNAWLGDVVVRYTFDTDDFHILHLAGLTGTRRYHETEQAAQAAQ